MDSSGGQRKSEWVKPNQASQPILIVQNDDDDDDNGVKSKATNKKK